MNEREQQNAPAFPNLFSYFNADEGRYGFPIYSEGGLTKREFFAAHAMGGLCGYYGIDASNDFLVRHALNRADAIIAALDAQAEAMGEGA